MCLVQVAISGLTKGRKERAQCIVRQRFFPRSTSARWTDSILFYCYLFCQAYCATGTFWPRPCRFVCDVHLDPVGTIQGVNAIGTREGTAAYGTTDPGIPVTDSVASSSTSSLHTVMYTWDSFAPKTLAMTNPLS